MGIIRWNPGLPRGIKKHQKVLFAFWKNIKPENVIYASLYMHTFLSVVPGPSLY